MTTNRIVFRADASVRWGYGHVRRCLSLASALSRLGFKPEFVTRPLGASAGGWLEESGLDVHFMDGALDPDGWEADANATAELAGDCAWVVVDHYLLDRRWHEVVRDRAGCKLAVIDDQADRPLSGDLIVNPNLPEDRRNRYAAINLRPAKALCGPRFALLDKAFSAVEPVKVRPKVDSIGIFMGGADSAGASFAALDALEQIGFAGLVEVVTSRANPALERLKARCREQPARTLSTDLPNLAKFFSRHDVQIGAGGGAMLERARCGAPSVVTSVAANQDPGIAEMENLGCIVRAGDSSAQALAAATATLLSDAQLRRELAQRSRSLVDGRGAERVALVLAGHTLTVRPAGMNDCEMLYRWRNAEATRATAHQAQPFDLASHTDWFKKALRNPSRLFFVGEVGECEIGLVRFDRVVENEFQVSIYLDPELHGLGLGPILLTAGERHLRQREEGPVRIVAEIVEGNSRSIGMLKRTGYRGGPARMEKELP